MNTGIEKLTSLNKTVIESNRYTLSLLDYGSQIGLMDQHGIDQVQTAMLSILKGLIIKYTRGKSTSLKVDTAQSILVSILYSTDARLSIFSEPEDALTYLKTNNIEHIYNEGLKLVKLCVDETNQLYQKIADNKLNVSLDAYHTTIDEALPEFFATYDPIFSAQDTITSMDYPLLFDDTEIEGIYYIKQYLEKLAMEDCFCSLFSSNSVEKLLTNYGQVYCIDYRETLFNLFEVLLTNSIFSVLIGNSANDLSISPSQFELLKQKFNGLPQTDYSSLISQAIEILIQDLNINQPALNNYIWRYPSLLMPRFCHALEHNNLMNVIILDRQETQPVAIKWDQGNNMGDEDFRLMVDQILECSDGAEKAALINSNIHSLRDFIDVLEADCLFDDEYTALFNTLGSLELSILARIVFTEELRTGGINYSLGSAEEKQLEMPWQAEFVRYWQRLSSEKIRDIEYHIFSSFPSDGSSEF